jgi:hypothetical protein
VRISERLLTVLVLCLLVAAVPAFAGGNGERELKQAQNLVEQKQYSTALEQIVKIMKDYPDLREEADKLVARIMDVRRQFNEKYGALVEILGQDVVEERDVEKGLAIVEELRNLDPNPDPAVDASIRLAERKLQEQGQFRFFGNIMRKAAGELADGKYTEAIKTYLGGFAVSRADFDAANHPPLLSAQALNDVARLETVSRQAAEAPDEKSDLQNELEALLRKSVTEAVREGFLEKLQALRQARDREAQIRALAASIRAINAGIDAANGDSAPFDLWLYFMEQYALGRPDEKPEGLAFAVRQPWIDTAQKLSDAAYRATEAAYAATDEALKGEVVSDDFGRLADEALNRGLIALGVIEVETAGWQPAEGLTLSSAERTRAADLVTWTGLIRQRMVDAEQLGPFIAAEAMANDEIRKLDARLKDLASQTSTNANDLARSRTAFAEIRKSAGDGEAEWRSRAASATPGSVMAGRASAVRSKFADAATRALRAGADIALRIAGLEADGFAPRRVAAEARQAKGRALTAGTAVEQVPVGKWPDLANQEYERALDDLRKMLGELDTWLAKWTSEPVLAASDGFTELLAAQAGLRVRAGELQASINADKVIATSAVNQATQLRGQGESAYLASQTMEKQKKYVEALDSARTARTSYADSLNYQENGTARVRLEELQQLIQRVEIGAKQQNLAAAQTLIDKGTRLYFDRDYEGAIATLEEARKLWETEAGSENTTITIYIERATASLKVTGKQEITRIDPIYEDIRGFMTQAELSYNRAASLQKTATRVDEYRSALAAARSSVQAITAVVPEYRDARLMALKIDQLELGPAEFLKELRALEDASIRDANNDRAGEINWRNAYYSLNAFKVYEKDARRLNLVNEAIQKLEVKLGLRDAPIPREKIVLSNNLYQEANTEYRKGPNDSFRWEGALRILQESLDENPLNKDAQALRNQIAVKRKTLVDVLSKAELEKARTINQDIINRNILRAEADIDDLLRAKPRNPLLLDLKGKIAR